MDANYVVLAVIAGEVDAAVGVYDWDEASRIVCSLARIHGHSLTDEEQETLVVKLDLPDDECDTSFIIAKELEEPE